MYLHHYIISSSPAQEDCKKEQPLLLFYIKMPLQWSISC